MKHQLCQNCFCVKQDAKSKPTSLCLMCCRGHLQASSAALSVHWWLTSLMEHSGAGDGLYISDHIQGLLSTCHLETLIHPSISCSSSSCLLYLHSWHSTCLSHLVSALCNQPVCPEIVTQLRGRFLSSQSLPSLSAAQCLPPRPTLPGWKPFVT